MTETTLRKNRRLILLSLLAGLGLIFIATLSYFTANPGLVMHAASNAPASEPANAPQGMGGMDEATQQGVMALMQKLQQNPTDVDALVGLAEHFMHTQDWQKAETFALRAVVSAPNETRPLYMLGIIQHSQNRHAEAAASLEKVIAAKEDPSVRYSLGILYSYYLQAPDKGIAQFEKALADPSLAPDLKKAIEEELKKAKEHKNHAPQQAQE